jgi:hypothetical protein
MLLWTLKVVRLNRKLQLECIVDVININKGHNTDIVEKCEKVSGYVTLIHYIREFQNEGLELEESLKLAIKKCIAEGILTEYLEKNSTKVFNMLFTEFNLDDALEVSREEGREEGKEEGLHEGQQKGEDVISNVVLEAIAKGYTTEQIKELLEGRQKS